jgi:cohesin complex subunit SA-1/2
VKDLKANIAGLKKESVALDNIIDEIYKGCFMHRFRDVSIVVREDTITMFSAWLSSRPHVFLTNEYTKYIGWQFNDVAPAVRIAAIKSFVELYKVKEHVSKFELFLEKFKKHENATS